MSSTKKQFSTKKMVPAIPRVVTSATTPASVSDPPVAGAVAGASSLALSTTPPDLTIPAPPAGFVPVNFQNYRGFYPRAGEFTAIPDVVLELAGATSYASTFGGAVPAAATVAGDLDTASRWTALRVALEAYLVYVRSVEVITWKTATLDIDKLRASFKVVAAQNPGLIAAFPATERLLDVQKVIGQRAAASRARDAKAKLAAAANGGTAATPVTAAVATPNSGTAALAAMPVATAVPVASAVVSATSGGGTGGGVTH
jgi:hypothetical protein